MSNVNKLKLEVEMNFFPTTIPFSFSVSCLICRLMMSMALAPGSAGTTFCAGCWQQELSNGMYREQLSSKRWNFLNHSCKQTQVRLLKVEQRSYGCCSLSVALLPEAALQTHSAEIKLSLWLRRRQDRSAAPRSRWCSCYHAALEEKDKEENQPQCRSTS